MQLSIIFPGTPVKCSFYPDWLIFIFEEQKGDQAIISIGGTGFTYVPITSLSIEIN